MMDQSVQKEIWESGKILEMTSDLIKKATKMDFESSHPCNDYDENIRKSLRFICNVCTGNSDICEKIWPILLKKGVFEMFLENLNVRFEILVLLYNICQAFRANYKSIPLPVFNGVLRIFFDDNNQDVLFFSLNIIKQSFLECIDCLERVDIKLLVGAALSLASDENEFSSPPLPVDLACNLIKNHLIPEIEKKTENATIVSMILELFELTVHRYNKESRELLCSSGLAVVCVGLLKMEMSVPRESLQYLLKVKLLKILANLAYESRFCQDDLALLGLLPLLLNLTKIEDENPFMREWSVFALRNMLDNNPENQEFVKNVQPVQQHQ